MTQFRTRAKFYLSGLELLPGQNSGVRVTLSAVSRGDRNAEWATATPIGNITMTINNPTAAQAWEDFMQAARRTGKQPEMFVDLYPSEDGWPGDGHSFRATDKIPEGVYGHGKCAECGMGETDDLMKWDQTTQKNEVIGKAHPKSVDD